MAAQAKNRVYKVTNSTRRSEYYIARSPRRALLLAAEPLEAGGYRLIRDPYSKSVRAEREPSLELNPDVKAIIKTGQTGRLVCENWVNREERPPWRLSNSYYAAGLDGMLYGPFPNSYSVCLARAAGLAPEDALTVQATLWVPEDRLAFVDWKQVQS